MGIVLKNVNITGGKLSSTIDASTGWVRNPDWLPLPEITAADNRFVGLFLVFENEYNQTTFYGNNGSFAIDWGDGTSDVSNSAVQTHVYDYSTIVSPINQYYDGRNYKQVIIDIVQVNTPSFFIIDRNNGINNNGGNNFVDINMSFPNVSNISLSSQRKLHILERLAVYDVDTFSSNSWFLGMYKLQELIFPFEKSSTLINSSFHGLQYIGDLNLTNCTNLSIAFSGVFWDSCGDINSGMVTTFIRLFENAKKLRRTGTINCLSATTIQQIFNGCESLNKTHLINCGSIVTTTNAFNLNSSLSDLILDGLTVGFSIANCNLTDTALNDLFTSLGTASGSQTIIITGNPGAATCDTTIATGKGFTVTT